MTPTPDKKLTRNIRFALQHLQVRHDKLMEKRELLDAELKQIDAAIAALKV